MDYYAGEIRAFCGPFVPIDFFLCDGSAIVVNSATAGLYAIIGRNFTPDSVPQGRFCVPDLRGRVPIGMGTGPGLSPYTIGQSGGSSSYTLNSVPNHTHQMMGVTNEATLATAASNLPAVLGTRIINYRSVDAPDVTLNAGTIGSTGQATPDPVSNMQPYLPLNFIICYGGVVD